MSTYFLAIDFEKNGLNMDPIFEITIKLEAIEVTYHHVTFLFTDNTQNIRFIVNFDCESPLFAFQFAMMEMIHFFKFNTNYIHDTVLGLYKLWDYTKRKYLSFVEDIISQTLRINFKIDIKTPYIIFPEHGSIQKYVLSTK